MDPATLTALHTHFLAAVAPRIEQQAAVSFRRYARNREMVEELTQEAMGLGWHHYLTMKLKGEKEPEDFISAFAARVCQAARNGRRITGQERTVSISNPRTQSHRGICRQSLPEFDTGAEDLLRAIQDERDSPPDMAAYLIDTNAWLAGLPERKRELAMDMAAGDSTAELAVKYGMTAGRVSQVRRELVEDNARFYGGRGR